MLTTQKTLFTLIIGFIFITGCSQETSPQQTESSIQPAPLVEKIPVEAGEDIPLKSAPINLTEGMRVYNTICMGCHVPGLLNAPKLGDKDAWAPRIAQGMDILVAHSINGFKVMPARGGNPSLSDEELRNAVAYMVSKSQ